MTTLSDRRVSAATNIYRVLARVAGWRLTADRQFGRVVVDGPATSKAAGYGRWPGMPMIRADTVRDRESHEVVTGFSREVPPHDHECRSAYPPAKYADEWPVLAAEFTAATRAEPGNICFDWFRSVDDPNVYLLVEMFRDRAAGDAHLNSDHFGSLPWGRSVTRTPGCLRSSRRGSG